MRTYAPRDTSYSRRSYAAQDSRPSWEKRPFVLTTGRMNLVKTIMQERGVTAEAMLKAFPVRPSTKEEFETLLSWLKGQNVVSTPTTPQAKGQDNWDDIPNGNYAYEYNGKTHFYRVSRREGRGQYAGRTFVKVQERASDQLYRVDNYGRAKAILRTIREEGVEACGIRFAEKLGSCRFCMQSLTDEDNPYKARGAGPDCGPKYLG